LVAIGTPADATTDMDSGLQAWFCGGAGTTVDKQYLPSSCRGNWRPACPQEHQSERRRAAFS